MDSTAIGIITGLVFTGIFAGMLLYFKRSFDLQHTILVFVSSFSVPGGIGLIFAGFSGSPENLPSNWREHVVVAGIVAIGLATKYVVTRILGCRLPTGKATLIDAKRADGGG